jgi:hypothetical protein
MSLAVARVAAVLFALLLVGAALRWRERVRGTWRKFWSEPTSPVNAAVLRIFLFYTLMKSAIGQNPVWYARLPLGERELPLGWGWLGSLPFDEALASGAEDALIVSSAAAMLGLFTRVSAPCAALLAVYVLGLPNFFAKINHAHHIRVLSALVLAFSPCGDALSLDRLFRRLRGHAPPPPSLAYTLPVRFVWLLLATTYFFPGLWKLWESGDQWITGAKLEFELYKRWAATPDFEPLFRIDRHRWLMALLGSLTLVFEIGFVFALFKRVTRTIAALSAVGFHLGISAIMGIHFHAFFPLILLLEIPERWETVRRHVPEVLMRFTAACRNRLAEWRDAVLRRVRPRGEPRPWPLRAVWPPLVVGAVVLWAQAWTGFAKINSWPVSVYPLFSDRAGTPPTTGKLLRVYLEADGEKRVDLGRKLRRLGPARLRNLLGDLDRKLARSKAKHGGRTLVALFHRAGVHLEPGDQVLIYEATWRVLPPGERSNYREKLSRRYLVTEDRALALLR